MWCNGQHLAFSFVTKHRQARGSIPRVGGNCFFRRLLPVLADMHASLAQSQANTGGVGISEPLYSRSWWGGVGRSREPRWRVPPKARLGSEDWVVGATLEDSLSFAFILGATRY